MNRNVPASFGLSVVIVLFFAVVLYQPDPPPASVGRVEAPVRSDPSPAPLTTTHEVEVEVSTAATIVPPTVPTTDRRSPAQASEPASAPVAVLVERRAPTPPARTVSRREPIVEAPKEPRGAFTQSRAGESLSDVAQRVYGKEDQARALWLANRDVLDRVDSPLRPGTLLRTP